MSQRDLIKHAVCVFCGARPGNDPRYIETATAVGEAIARRGLILVYGGGSVGLMGAVANGALAVGGEVVGIMPRKLMERELGHAGLTRLEVVPDMAVRKTRMIELSDSFLSLPGGMGTLDEIFEVLTLRQVGYHSKPSGLLDQMGYYQPLMKMLHSLAKEGFVSSADVDRIIIQPEIESLLDQLTAPANPS
jgi:uncharacterized protein (TIGR00730 family)